MDGKYLMVNDAFDEVEQAPAQNKLPDKRLKGGNRITSMIRAPLHQNTNQRDYPDKSVEQTVPHHVETHGFHCCWREPVGNHVVPLEYLMQDDSIYEAAHVNPHQNPGGCSFAAVLVLGHVSDTSRSKVRAIALMESLARLTCA